MRKIIGERIIKISGKMCPIDTSILLEFPTRQVSKVCPILIPTRTFLKKCSFLP